MAAPKLWSFLGTLKELDSSGLGAASSSRGQGKAAAEDSRPTRGGGNVPPPRGQQSPKEKPPSPRN